MMKSILLILVFGLLQLQAQTGPSGYVGPVAPVGATAIGWKYLQTDSNGKLYLAATPASSSQGGPTGYVAPMVLVGQAPNGTWLYLQVDANGNLLTSGNISACGTSPPRPLVQPMPCATLL